MLTGNNRIIVCYDEMKEAVQYYLNNIVLRYPVVVTGITQEKTDQTFTIRVTEHPDKVNALNQTIIE